MTYEDFAAHLAGNDTPPESISEDLKALWYARKGSWDQAHRIAQDIHTAMGSRIHANLHREEGDESNARYWYNRAGCAPSPKSIEDERAQLIHENLAN